MPTTTSYGLVKPSSGAEPADMYGVSTRLADSADTAIAKVDSVFTTLWARSATLSISNATDTLVLWNTTTNTGSGYNVYWSQSAGTVTIIEDGVYGLSAFVEWAGPATPAGYRSVYLNVNGAFYDGLTQQAVTTASTVTRMKYIAVGVPLSAGDTIGLWVAHNHGSAININTGTKLRITRLGTQAV